MDKFYCTKCGAQILIVTLTNGKTVPLDRYSMEERYALLPSGEWIRTKAGNSHHTTCQGKRRYSLQGVK